MNDLIFGLPGFKDFSGAFCKVNEELMVTKFKMDRNRKSQTNTYTGYSLAYYPINGNDAVLISTPKFNNFNGKVID